MRIFSAILGLGLVIGLVACSHSDQEKAKEQAQEDVRKASEEAKKIGQDIKNDAPHAEEKAKDAAARAEVKLDHAALVAKVKTKLATDAGLTTLAHVEVIANGSVVTLSGSVANESQKKSAEIAASQVDGVTQVRNRLAVQP